LSFENIFEEMWPNSELPRYTVGMEISGTHAEAGKDASTAFTIPFPAPAQQFFRWRRISRVWRRLRVFAATRTKLLQQIVTLLGSSTAAKSFPWSRLDYATTIQLRQALVSRYAPATANLALCALRGVLREAWLLGQISFEDFKRAGDLARVRGDRTKPRKSADTVQGEPGKCLNVNGIGPRPALRGC
jgi:hypothetical protein